MSLMEKWREEIIESVQKKWGFLESNDIKVQQLITQVCIYTMEMNVEKIKNLSEWIIGYGGLIFLLLFIILK